MGMQMPRDISASCTLEAQSEEEPFGADDVFFSLPSNLNEFGKYKRPLSPGLIPIRCPSDTLLS